MIIKKSELINKKYKIVICGSGPAGVSLALELEKKNIECLIIEAGDEFYSDFAQKRYEGKVLGNFPEDISITRLSQFGGTTGHWGGTCRTLDDYDFNEWPIKKKDLDPYLKKSCEILEIPNVFRERNINENLKLIEFQESNVRFYEKYFEHITKSKLIHLCLNCSIYNILMENNVVKKIIIDEEKNFSIEANFLVLACGGIENSRLLLWFREHNKNISKKLPIGNYWMEHPFKKIGSGVGNFNLIREKLKNEYEKFENFRNWGNFTVSVSPTQKLIKDKNILNSSIFLTLHDRDNDNLKNNIKDLLCVAPNLSNKIIKLFNKNLLCGITVSSSWEQEATFNNKITLSSSKDSTGIPKTILEYEISKNTIKTAQEMINQIGLFFINYELGRIGGDPEIYKLNSFISDAGYHHIGGTRMGKNKNNSVVDENLKVHETENLFVCGSSTFTTGGHANPTLSIVQLSLKLADHLNDKLRAV